MPRKSQHLDEKMLTIGQQLLTKKGASGFNIRELTTKANVNLGMFSYHFKNKDNFVQLVLEKIYQEMINELHFSKESIDDPLARLEAYLLTLSYFARDNRELIVSLIKDVLEEQKIVRNFLRKTMRKHFVLLATTIREAQKQNKIIQAPLIFIITHIIGSIGLTNLTPTMLKKIGVNQVFNLALKLATAQIDSDQAIQLRVTLTINGLKNIQEAEGK